MTVAARHRDWPACARILFGLLFSLPTEVQQEIAAETISEYINIWNEKHPTLTHVPLWFLQHKADRQSEIPGFPADLDPADAEFETALMEFVNGTSASLDHAERTKHFATTIRSSILARQMNRWLHDYPLQYERWKRGLPLEGPSFLDDAGAHEEAAGSWKRVDKLIGKQRSKRIDREIRNIGALTEAFHDWEKSLL